MLKNMADKNSKRLHSAIGYKALFEVYGYISETKKNIVTSEVCVVILLTEG